MSKTKGITKRERDCLLVIGEDIKNGFPDRLVNLSRKLQVSSPTVMNLLDRLDQKGLIRRLEGMVTLTDLGMQTYGELMESHRVIEYIFYKNGIPEDECCKEASKIDYIIEQDVISRLFMNLGEPSTCPHGRRIRGD